MVNVDVVGNELVYECHAVLCGVGDVERSKTAIQGGRIFRTYT